MAKHILLCSIIAFDILLLKIYITFRRVCQGVVCFILKFNEEQSPVIQFLLHTISEALFILYTREYLHSNLLFCFVFQTLLKRHKLRLIAYKIKAIPLINFAKYSSMFTTVPMTYIIVSFKSKPVKKY